MPILSFGVMVSIIAYFLFPQHTFAQIPKEDDKQIVFNTQNKSITPNGFFTIQDKETQAMLNLPELPAIDDSALIAINNPDTILTPTPPSPPKPKNKNISKPNGPVIINHGKEYRVVATAYSSTVDQTDSSPFITASGTRVHDGTLAANFLKFGTKVKIPDIYGDRIFIVEDRMRDNHKIDVWFPSREQALKFGVKRTKIVVSD